MCFVKTFWFSVILAFHSTACGKCSSRVWHICRDAPRPEKNPRQSECFCRARLLPFLFFCFLFLLHAGQHGTLCPRILSVLQHPRTQAGMLLLQWCCGTRRCEGTHTQRTSNKTFRNKYKATIFFFFYNGSNDMFSQTYRELKTSLQFTSALWSVLVCFVSLFWVLSLQTSLSATPTAGSCFQQMQQMIIPLCTWSAPNGLQPQLATNWWT